MATRTGTPAPSFRMRDGAMADLAITAYVVDRGANPLAGIARRFVQRMRTALRGRVLADVTEASAFTSTALPSGRAKGFIACA
jgi:hypothetical protein